MRVRKAQTAPSGNPGGMDPAIRKAAYRWNTIAGLLFTAQSVVMLVFITRICDVYTAGVFTIAFAVGNLFMNMGMYGMRKFQVSDRTREFTFREYRASRMATSLAMIACSAAYIAYTATTLGYEPEKTAIIFVMCLFKCVDVVEDVYCGAYQQADRLDVGARMVSLRQIVTMAVFVAALLATRSLLAALVATTAFTAVFLAGQCRYVARRYAMPDRSGMLDGRRVAQLLKECFPLFAAAFLLFYIGSAPKYAIDSMMDDAVQAYFGYISMPVFAVSILATFVYNPMVTELTDLWNQGALRIFLKRFAKLAGVVAIITAICDALAFLLGVPVLNILYSADVGPYLPELIILVTGGGFLALATLATVGITIIRFQRVLVPLYAILAIAAYAISNYAVAGWGITGASWAYFAIMGCAAAVFSVAFTAGSIRGAHAGE